jgi:hypothetical protein
VRIESNSPSALADGITFVYHFFLRLEFRMTINELLPKAFQKKIFDLCLLSENVLFINAYKIYYQAEAW